MLDGRWNAAILTTLPSGMVSSGLHPQGSPLPLPLVLFFASISERPSPASGNTSAPARTLRAQRDSRFFGADHRGGGARGDVAAPRAQRRAEHGLVDPRNEREQQDVGNGEIGAGFSVAEITAADVGLARALDVCEQRLERHPWLAGADFTIADILLFPLVARIGETMLGPALRAWRGHVAARPAASVSYTHLTLPTKRIV